jgi:hypothetical protein
VLLAGTNKFLAPDSRTIARCLPMQARCRSSGTALVSCGGRDLRDRGVATKALNLQASDCAEIRLAVAPPLAGGNVSGHSIGADKCPQHAAIMPRSKEDR